MKKHFYFKITGERYDPDIITLWQTVFIDICVEKARLLIGTDAFRLGLLASQSEVIYKCRVDESFDIITPFVENTLKIVRAQELDLLGKTFELEEIQELVDDYLEEHFIVVNEGSI
jgi:hypothetical protein